nr:MAG TPA: hypothetical protein [Caudoviricetes sp.]
MCTRSSLNRASGSCKISRKRGGHLTCNQLSGRFRLKFEGGGRKSTVSPVVTAILRSTTEYCGENSGLVAHWLAIFAS